MSLHIADPFAAAGRKVTHVSSDGGTEPSKPAKLLLDTKDNTEPMMAFNQAMQAVENHVVGLRQIQHTADESADLTKSIDNLASAIQRVHSTISLNADKMKNENTNPGTSTDNEPTPASAAASNVKMNSALKSRLRRAVAKLRKLQSRENARRFNQRVRTANRMEGYGQFTNLPVKLKNIYTGEDIVVFNRDFDETWTGPGMRIQEIVEAIGLSVPDDGYELSESHPLLSYAVGMYDLE